MESTQSNGKLKFMKNKLWSSIALCQSRSKYARREARREEKQSEEENRGQQLQSSCVLLEHFPKSIFYMLYTISKLRKSKIQCFKRCTIGVETKELQPLQADYSKLKKAFCKSVAKSPFCCEMISQPFCTVLWIPS